MLGYISFGGFYGYYDEYIDMAIEREIEYRTEDLSNENAEYIRSNWDMDYQTLHYAITNKYVDFYKTALNDFLKDNDLPVVNFDFDKLISPREYNFSNDTVEIRISEQDLITVRKLADRLTNNEGKTFKQYVHDRMTPCDGFIPFYSQNVNMWGDVTDWKQAQIEVLFDFVLNYKDFEDSREWLYFEIYIDNLVSEFIHLPELP